MRFARHFETHAVLSASVEAAFAYLDDFAALSAHMEKRSPMMMGSKMRIGTDELGGKAVGSHVRMEGRVLGIRLCLEEVVTQREPPLRKAWETVAARLLVIGQYRLGFELAPMAERSALRVFIDYELPARLPSRWLASRYARWCTERMARDAQRHFDAGQSEPRPR